MKSFLKNILNKPLNALGFELRRNHPDFYLHEYSSYEEYRSVQVKHNKGKIDHIWADEETLDLLISRIEQLPPKKKKLFGLCHGARNGFEQNYIRSKINADVIGTDISETSTQFQNSVHWDFHDKNEEWLGKCDFIYTNSLDQSWQPQEALKTWLGQLNLNGLLFIEHTEAHGPQNAGEMDPFGVKPHHVPFVLCNWFGHGISVEVIKSVKSNNELEVWLFVIKKNLDTST